MDTNTHSRKNFRIPFKMRIAMLFIVSSASRSLLRGAAD